MVDEYERAFMAGEGEVLHRQKAMVPRWAIGLAAGLPAGGATLVALILGLLGVISVLPALAILGGGLLYGALMTAFMVVAGVTRISVSEGEIHVQMGLSHLRIPIEEIEKVEIGASGTRARGLGLRVLLDGTRVYNMFGDPQEAIRIQRKGESKSTVLICREPRTLRDAVEGARARASASGAKVRAAPLGEEAAEEIAAREDGATTDVG